jgi:predicted nucleotide-binding protein
MNLVPFQNKVAALTDDELTAAAMVYLDEDTATLHAAPYEDLHYRYALLTGYKRRISDADPIRVERVLDRVTQERQTREPHRVLGGVVPPLRDEVTVESVAKKAAGETLTRTRKIELLGTYIAEGSKLTSGGPRRAGDVIRRGDPRTPEERWRDDVAKALEQVDAPAAWLPLIVPTDTSTPSMTRAIELLGVLVCRIEAGKPLDLTESHRDALATMVTLVVWADHLASMSNGNYNARTWERRDYESFLAELPLVADAAERFLAKHVDRDSLSHALELIRTHVDIDSFVARLNHRMFHAACAMWALAWWMSDALQDLFTIGHTPCATFREVRASRAELVGRGHLSCPRCGGEVSFARDELRIIELPMANWTCASCNIAGFFPEKAVPESPWAESPGSDSDPNSAPDLAAQMDLGRHATDPSANVAMDAVYALNRTARSLLTYLHGAHFCARGSAFTLPFSEEVQKSAGLDYPSFKQAAQRLDERGLAKRVGQEVTSTAAGVQAAEDSGELDRLLPLKAREESTRAVLSTNNSIHEANRKARRLLAFLHEWSMKGGAFRIGPCDETTQATGLEGEDYKRAAERLMRKGLAKQSGTGYRITITTDGVRVAEDEAALDHELPVASDSAEKDDKVPMPDKKKVFVIHGRCAPARHEMGVFLRSLGLEPVWFRDVRKNMGGTVHIIKVVEQGMKEAHGVLALITPDEFSALRPALRKTGESGEIVERWQARPNVLFEAGMAYARDPDRVAFVLFGDAKLFTDASGMCIFWPTNDHGPDSDRAQLRDLLGGGMQCEINTKHDWMTSGDFNTVISGLSGVSPRDPFRP